MHNISIILNGISYSLQERTTLHDLLNNLGFNKGNIAIAINNNIIPKAKYLEVWLQENDKVELVTAFQGG
ncbi:MAG: ThiS family [Pseudomonadota bacterium]|nr:ThiS family [Pseudomonadota bacterium]